jgi:hypothetical protein
MMTSVASRQGWQAFSRANDWLRAVETGERHNFERALMSGLYW